MTEPIQLHRKKAEKAVRESAGPYPCVAALYEGTLTDAKAHAAALAAHQHRAGQPERLTLTSLRELFAARLSEAELVDAVRIGYHVLTDYQCEHSEITPLCAEKDCPFWVRKHEDDDRYAVIKSRYTLGFTVTACQVLNTEPRTYLLTINDKEMRFTSEQLATFSQFARAVLEQGKFLPSLDPVPAKERARSWTAIINEWMRDAPEVTPPAEATRSGMLEQVVELFVYVQCRQSDDRVHLLNGARVIEGGEVWIKRDRIIRALKERYLSGPMPNEQELWDVLRGMGAKSRVVRIAGKPERIVAFPMREMAADQEEIQGQAPNDDKLL